MLDKTTRPRLDLQQHLADLEAAGLLVRIDRPITPDSILARCDLWLADYREQPEVPDAWAHRGWKLWQYVADESEDGTAYGATPRAIPGITHCDRNLFNGDAVALQRYWGVGGRTGV